jgi:hypothetical protein
VARWRAADIDGASAEETAFKVVAGGKAHGFACDVAGRKAFADMALSLLRCGHRRRHQQCGRLEVRAAESVTGNVDRMLGAGFKSAIWGSSLV